MIAPASRVLMVRPRTFQSNTETASTNAFQQTSRLSPEDVARLAVLEFDSLKTRLIDVGIEVICHDEPADAKTPDAIFPNNWFAVLPDGKVFLFPMFAPNRRREIQPSWLASYVRQPPIVDLRFLCQESLFLEGTGSLILNHAARTGYACLSQRTNATAIQHFERASGYKIQTFQAFDASGTPFYHTNVMMAHGLKTVIVCMESITNHTERELLTKTIAAAGQQLVEISQTQVLNFAGNMLLLSNKEGKRFWICSERALHSLNATQRRILEQDGSFISSSLTTIEDIGGGSARCMLGELF